MAVVDKGRRALYYNRNKDHSVVRVGLMHGLYHHWSDLRDSDGLRECNLNIVKMQRFEQRDPLEIACDLFAAEVLVPLDVLDHYAPDRSFRKGKS